MHATLIVKGTRLCNLRCQYCNDWRAGPDQTMPFEVLARLIASVLGDPCVAKATFIWHGGETTLLPIRFYEKAMLLQSRFRRPGQQIENLIQTNGTRLTPDWVRFFRDNAFGVGVSIDGPPDIHNRYRLYADGRPSWDDVYRGLQLLPEFELPNSVLMVIDELALEYGPRRIFDFMLDHGIKKFGLLAAKPRNQPNADACTPTDHYVSPSTMNPFLIEMYKVWEEYGDPGVVIRELDVITQRLLGGSQNSCTVSGKCFGTFFLVEPDGRVSHCDVFQGDPEYTFGNIMTDDFAALRQSQQLLSLQLRNQRDLEKMKAHCPEFEVCNGWCPHERYASARHNLGHSEDCCGLHPLISFIRSRLNGCPSGLQPVRGR